VSKKTLTRQTLSQLSQITMIGDRFVLYCRAFQIYAGPLKLLDAHCCRKSFSVCQSPAMLFRLFPSAETVELIMFSCEQKTIINFHVFCNIFLFHCLVTVSIFTWTQLLTFYASSADIWVILNRYSATCHFSSN
jgi:hypothetical protein